MRAGKASGPGGWRAWRARLGGCCGAQLVEFALVLPLLVVVVVGIADFGAGYTLKDKLANAARDGARVAVSQPNDLTNSQSTACNGAPCSVQSAATAVVNYLNNSKPPVNTCGMAPSSTSPALPPPPFTWTYSAATGCPGTMSIKIERAVPTTVNGATVFMTRVTLSYPFTWSFGRIIRFLVPSASYANPIIISSSAVMQNLN